MIDSANSYETLKKRIAKRVQFLRENSPENETQDALARAIDVSKDTISKIEQNKINLTLENAIKIAQHYGKSIDWICGLSDDMENPNKTVETLLNYVKPITMNINLANSHHLPALAINRKFNQLLETLRDADKLRHKGVPEKVLTPWINEETQKFTQSMTSDTTEDAVEYALLSYKHLADDDMMRKLEELDEQPDPDI